MLRELTEDLVIASLLGVIVLSITFTIHKATSTTKESCNKAGWIYLENYTGIGKCVNLNDVTKG